MQSAMRSGSLDFGAFPSQFVLLDTISSLVTGLIYRHMTWSAFKAACLGAARTSGMVLFIIGCAGAFGWLMAYMQVPTMMVDLLQTLTDNPILILLLINVILLILGTFMDMAPLIIICTPIFLPVAKAYGIDPIHFGLVLVLTGGLGLVTPPVGSVLFIGTAIGKISVGESMRSIWPFWFAALAVLFIVTFFPQLSLWLPALLRA